ncbi:efflux RND transporter periplasmic adaptor subunit [Jejubacter calystegiae]|uniref:Efflux RND transporter periplasmic adaptor subunit n=1 Tax=Jejubacter calystegiae TaxID=2579935 RepID=A0A4P8YNI6_9ENTR|nr:efflux RND transporter periplasmic adaptor subunit [Jejubacter calystegiae]QCT20162.1 efflux RND transporter periplasmic adaptor subunit [Jejubacter calystegiae]
MKLKTALPLVTAAIALLAGGYWLGSLSHRAPAGAEPQNPQQDRKVLYWYDPMVPGTRFDKPGKSPFMDMELVPRYADETRDDNGVQISARQQQNLGVRTAPVTLRTFGSQLAAFGTVATDQRSITTVSAPAAGQVEKLLVSAPQQLVKRNAPLARLWIPQWTAAQQEYLAVRQMGDSALTRAARARLRLQFMPESVIRAVERSGAPQPRITLYAPRDGYISKLDVRTGSQVAANQGLFEVAALDPVWMVIDYPESQASQLRQGMKVKATTASWPGDTFHGAIAELLPDLEATTRTLKARVVLDNPCRRLKPGMILNVQLADTSQNAPVLTIPEEALIATRDGGRVLIKEGDGLFRPVAVTTGQSGDGMLEVRSGLQEGQQVVTSGQFLIDSEASLRSALPQMGDSPAESTPQSWSTHGVIMALNPDSVTIAHDPVPALKWSAMTMDFTITSQQKAGLKTGERVMFSFTMDDDGVHIASIMPMSDEAGHDHKEQP